MNTFKAIGQLIEQKRKDINMSQEELAEKLNVSKATISLYESGSRKPTLKRLNQISHILKTPISDFLSLDIVKDVDLDLALRAEGISNDDIERIKLFIKALKDAEETKQEESKK